MPSIMTLRCSGLICDGAAICSSLGPAVAPPSEPPAELVPSTRASAPCTNSTHGAPCPNPDRGRPRGRARERRAPSRSGLRAIAVLLGGEAEEVARLHVVAVE